MRKQTFTPEQIADLRDFLKHPPAPPKPQATQGVRNLLRVIAPEVRALLRAGYAPEQVVEFLAARDVQISVVLIRPLAAKLPTKRVGKALRGVEPEGQPVQGVSKGVFDPDAQRQSDDGEGAR
ncbi:MAG: hypothetical protein M0T84_07100 [Betaproteobacteria bacterium]|nr:hypothetical protein [Betaproteobacteria bacterium]